jgi:hypothetical protein
VTPTKTYCGILPGDTHWTAAFSCTRPSLAICNSFASTIVADKDGKNRKENADPSILQEGQASLCSSKSIRYWFAYLVIHWHKKEKKKK